jgi:oligopeptidase B
MQLKTFLPGVLLLSMLYTAAQKQPTTKKEFKHFTEHGHQRTDAYYWLNDPADSNVINHLKEENVYVESYMKKTEGLQKELYSELVSRLPAKDQSLPVKRNGYWYYSRFEEGQQYALSLRKKGKMTAKEEMVLDGPALAKGHKIYLLRSYAVSQDNRLIAYAADTSGNRRSILYIKDLQTGKLFPENIPNTSGNYAWINDNKALYYVLDDHTVRAYKVMRHHIGTDPSSDKEIYTEKDSTYEVTLSKSRNGKYIFINSASTNTGESRWVDANDANAVAHLIQERTNGLEYSPHYFEGNVFHIYTNSNAKNFKYVTVPINATSLSNWKDLIPAN